MQNIINKHTSVEVIAYNMVINGIKSSGGLGPCIYIHYYMLSLKQN